MRVAPILGLILLVLLPECVFAQARSEVIQEARIGEFVWRLVDGRATATFRLPASHEIIAADGDRIWTSTKGALDEPVVVAWRITPAP